MVLTMVLSAALVIEGDLVTKDGRGARPDDSLLKKVRAPPRDLDLDMDRTVLLCSKASHEY